MVEVRHFDECMCRINRAGRSCASWNQKRGGMRTNQRVPPTHTDSPTIVDPDAFAEQKQIVEAALALERDDTVPLTIEAVCEQAGVDEAVFRAQFDSVEDLLPAYYELAVDQYRLLIDATADYESFSFEERLASFFYILLDSLGEHRCFVQDTFDHPVRSRSSFRSEVRAELRALLTDESVVPPTNQLVTGVWPVHEVLTEVTFAIVRHWIRDETNEQEATTALVDKLVSFVAELVTFGGVSRGLDLAWHIMQNDTLGLGRLPLIGWLFRRE